MRTRVARPGEDLQRLVRVIERATHQGGNVLVECPKRLPDKDTGKPREHDVVLTVTERHHKILMALECRDRSRKVGVPEVEAFHSKCQRTGIDRGIIVSSTGFARTALKKAASYNIGCLSLDQATRLNWCPAPGVHTENRHITHVHLHAMPERRVGAHAKLYANDGTLIGPEEAGRIASNCLKGLFITARLNAARERGVDAYAEIHANDGKRTRIGPEEVGRIGRSWVKGSPPPTNGRVTQGFVVVDAAPAFYLVDENGDRVGLRRLEIDVTYEFTSGFGPFEFREYVDMAEGKQLYTVAVAGVDPPGLEGDFVVMVHEEDRGAQVTLVPASRRPAR